MIYFDGYKLVEVDNYRLAIQIGPEALGSRVSPIPVIASVLSSPLVASAILRSGALPCFVDVSSQTMQIDPAQVLEVAQELDSTPILMLEDPLGIGFDQRLLDLNFPTIGIYNTPLTEELRDNCPVDIGVFSLEYYIGASALILAQHEDLRRTLEHICRGELGYYASLSKHDRYLVTQELRFDPGEENTQELESAYNAYVKLLQDAGKGGSIIDTNEQLSSHFYMRVRDSKKVIAHLHSYDLPGELVQPLYMFEEMAARWALTPEYPIADSVYKHIVKLPCDTYYVEQKAIVEAILEIEDGTKKEK